MGLIKFKICGVLKFENYLRYLIKFLLSLVFMKYRVLERGLCILIYCFGFINFFLL